MEREIFHLLVHSSHDGTSWCWARVKPRGQELHLSRVGWQDLDQISYLAFQYGLWMSQQLNPLPHNAHNMVPNILNSTYTGKSSKSSWHICIMKKKKWVDFRIWRTKIRSSFAYPFPKHRKYRGSLVSNPFRVCCGETPAWKSRAWAAIPALPECWMKS